MSQFKIKLKHSKKTMEWMYPVLVKLMDDMDWRKEEVQRSWLEEMIVEPEVSGTGLVVYTPVQTDATESVPLDWPESAYTENGEYVRQKTWEEYAKVIPVNGGVVFQFCQGQYREDKKCVVDDEGFRRWEYHFKGFLLHAELEEL